MPDASYPDTRPTLHPLAQLCVDLEIAIAIRHARRRAQEAPMTTTPMIAHTPVSSSMFTSIGYDAARQVLEVKMASGRIYSHANVPQEAYAKFAQSDSLGRHYNENIKNKFPHSVIGTVEE